MGNGFLKIKRKARLTAVLRGLLVGISLGTMVIAALWLVAKLTGAKPDFLRYGLIGGGAALVISGLMMLLLIPSEKRLAKWLDRKLSLNERVQTLVAFQKDTSDMAQLQREDTDRILLETPGKSLRSRRSWLLAIVPVLACVSMAVTIVVPAKGLPGPGSVDNSSWFLDVYDEQKLKDLIDYVRTSEMQEALRTGIAGELEDLLKDLKTVQKKTVMQETVVQAIVDIHALAKDFDSYSALVNALKAVPSDTTRLLGSYIGTLDETMLTEFLSGTPATDVEEAKPGLGDILRQEELTQAAQLLARGIRQALEASQQEESNPIYMALAGFADALEAVTEQKLPEVIEQAQKALCRAVEQPGLDRAVEKYTINRLLAIFGVPAAALPPEILAAFENEIGKTPVKPGETEQGPSSSGGYSQGEFVVGSDDDIYDPKLEQQVPYGQVIRDYLKIMTDSLDGTIPPELEEIITDYFAILLRKTEEN